MIPEPYNYILFIAIAGTFLRDVEGSYAYKISKLVRKKIEQMADKKEKAAEKSA